MEEYYDKLTELKNNCAISRQEHVNNIEKMQTRISEGLCPRCEGKLILRNGKYGYFYGCSNFPRCKFTKNAE